MRSRYQAVFFDLDGTISDSAEGICSCMQHALRNLGAPVPGKEELKEYIGPSIRETFATLLDSVDESRLDSAIRLYRNRYEVRGLFENELYPGISELMSTLVDSTTRLFIVTSKPKVYADRIVAHFRIDSYFDDVIGPDLAPGSIDDAFEIDRGP